MLPHPFIPGAPGAGVPLLTASCLSLQLMHPVLESLRSTDRQWLIDTLFAFNSGNVETFQALKSAWGQQVRALGLLKAQAWEFHLTLGVCGLFLNQLCLIPGSGALVQFWSEPRSGYSISMHIISFLLASFWSASSGKQWFSLLFWELGGETVMLNVTCTGYSRNHWHSSGFVSSVALELFSGTIPGWWVGCGGFLPLK